MLSLYNSIVICQLTTWQSKHLYKRPSKEKCFHAEMRNDRPCKPRLMSR